MQRTARVLLASLTTGMMHVMRDSRVRRRATRRTTADSAANLADDDKDSSDSADTSLLPFGSRALAQLASARREALLATLYDTRDNDSDTHDKADSGSGGGDVQATTQLLVHRHVQQLLSRLLHAPHDGSDGSHIRVGDGGGGDECTAQQHDKVDDDDEQDKDNARQAQSACSDDGNSNGGYSSSGGGHGHVQRRRDVPPPPTTALLQLRLYSPVLREDVVTRVSRALDVPHALHTARCLCALLRGKDMDDVDDVDVAEAGDARHESAAGDGALHTTAAATAPPLPRDGCAAMQLLQRILHAWSRERATQRAAYSAHEQQCMVELQSGIASRRWVRPTSTATTAAAAGRAPRLRACLLHDSDVQASEVLHDGRVVVLTTVLQPRTLSAAQHSNALTTALRQMLLQHQQQRQRCHDGATALHLHAVLYKEAGVTLTEARCFVRTVVAAHWRVLQQEQQQQQCCDNDDDDDIADHDAVTSAHDAYVLADEDIVVRSVLDSRAVTTQLCSIRLHLPARDDDDDVVVSHNNAQEEQLHKDNDDGNKASEHDTTSSRLSRVHAHTLSRAHALVQALFCVNQHTSNADGDNNSGGISNAVLVQPLSWQWHDCASDDATRHADTNVKSDNNSNNDSGSNSSSLVQYAVLLRGIAQAPRHLATHALRCATAPVVNYIAPHFFGDVDCPFRSVHVTAALSRGAYAEAIVMAASCMLWPCISSTHAPPLLQEQRHIVGDESAWLTQLLGRVCVESRPAVLREAWLRIAPVCVQASYREARASLLWNVLASCRIDAHTYSGSNMDSDGDGGGVMVTADAPPLVGELVREAAAVSEDAMDNSNSNSARSSQLTRRGVLPRLSAAATTTTVVCSDADAAAYTLHDVVLPLAHTPHVHATIDALARRLGVDVAERMSGTRGSQHHRRRRCDGRRQQDEGHDQDEAVSGNTATTAAVAVVTCSAAAAAALRVRPLLTTPSGAPRTRHVWARAFAEPIVDSDTDDSDATRTARPQTRRRRCDAATDTASRACVYTLATDATLAIARQRGLLRNYAAASRGSRVTAPHTRRRGGGGGHDMADRLPLGLLAASAAAAASSTSSMTTRLDASGAHHAESSSSSSGGDVVAMTRGCVEGSRGSSCLALHYTLPADGDGYALLQHVCGVVHDARAAVVQQRHRRRLAAAAAHVVAAVRGTNVADGGESVVSNSSRGDDNVVVASAVDGDVLSLPRAHWRDVVQPPAHHTASTTRRDEHADE